MVPRNARKLPGSTASYPREDLQHYYDISAKRNGRWTTASSTLGHHSAIFRCTQLRIAIAGLALPALSVCSQGCAAVVLDIANIVYVVHGATDNGCVYRGLTTLQAICGYESE